MCVCVCFAIYTEQSKHPVNLQRHVQQAARESAEPVLAVSQAASSSAAEIPFDSSMCLSYPVNLCKTSPNSCKALFIGAVRVQAAAFPEQIFSIHIDDLHQSVEGDGVLATVEQAVQAAAHLRHSFTNELGLPFAASKSFLLSNNKTALKLATRAFGEHAGEAVSTVRRLGYDHSTDPRRKNNKVISGRFKSARVRLRHLNRLCHG